MARIFLSYARPDAGRAQAVADFLEQADHDVWWDQRIGAGSSFAREIEKALVEADLVVVLWSKHSIESDWVRDEAATGRDNGRLVPALLDKSQPPLGFRQYQTVDVPIRGRPDALLDAIAAREGKSATGKKPQSHFTRTRWKLVAGLASLLLVLLCAWFISSFSSGKATSIAIVPANDDPRTVAFANGIVADLGRFRARPIADLELLPAENVRAATYRLTVGLGQSKTAPAADLTLERGGGSILWGGSIVADGATEADLRQQVLGQVGNVVRCLAAVEQGTEPRKREIVGLSLSACANPDPRSAIENYRALVRQAPDYGPGWAGLVATEISMVAPSRDAERARLIAAIKSDIKKAIALAPNDPNTFAAKAEFMRADAERIPRSLAILDEGIGKNPDSAQLRRKRSDRLLQIGRMNEAVDEARQAQELDPLSPQSRDAYISALAYSGRVTEAFSALAESERLWPGSYVLNDLRYRLGLRFGDAHDALRLLDAAGNSTSIADPTNQMWRSFLQARADPTTAKIEQSLDDFRATFRADPFDSLGYLQAAVTFGHVDEAYSILAAREAMDSMLAGPEVLFRPYMAPMRSDARFIALVAKLGLLQYWEKSGVWPDFCSERRRPYDCKVEAKKLTAKQRKVAEPVA